MHTKKQKEAKTQQPARSKQRKRMQSRENRQNRHRSIWAVLRIIVISKDIREAKDFYACEKALNDYHYILNYIKDYPITNEHIKTAIRFCQIKNSKKECEHRITDKETALIYKLKKVEFKQDFTTYLDNTLAEFEAYWNNVLISYKRELTLTNRLAYLVQYLTELEQKKFIKECPIIDLKIRQLREKYEMQMNKTPTK